MYNHIQRQYAVGAFAVILLFFGQISLVQAELISNGQVEAQKKEVLLGIVGLLQENVKFLQMVFIQKLEARVAYLRTIKNNQ